MDEQIVEKKEKNKVLIAVIVILVIIALALVGYICYDRGIIFASNGDKLSNNISEKKEEIVEEKVNLSLDDSKFIDIYNKLSTYTYENNRENGYQSFTETELGKIGIREFNSSDFTKTSEISEWGDNYYTFSGSTLIKKLEKYFGKEVTINKSNLVNFNATTEPDVSVDGQGSGITVVSYDGNSDTFKVRIGGIGGMTGPFPTIVERKIVSAQSSGDTISVSEKAIYYTHSTVNGTMYFSVYSDPAKAKRIDSKTFTENDASNVTISVDDYLDAASTITHTYKLNKNTNGYYFVSSNIK